MKGDYGSLNTYTTRGYDLRNQNMKKKKTLYSDPRGQSRLLDSRIISHGEEKPIDIEQKPQKTEKVVGGYDKRGRAKSRLVYVRTKGKTLRSHSKW